MLKKIHSDKMNDSKKPYFFPSRAPANHRFTFNLRFLYVLKHKVCLSKAVCGIFHFRFYQSLYFCFTKCIDCLTLKRQNSFQN